MAEVDTSIYRQQGGGPLGQAGGIVNLLGGLQNLQLQQQQYRTQQFNLNKAQSDAVISGVAPLATRDDVTKATALGTAASIIRANGIPPEVAGPILDQIRNSPDNPKALKQVLGNLLAIQMGASAGAPVTGEMQKGTFAPTTTPAGLRATQGTVPTQAGPKATAAAQAAGGAAGVLQGGMATEQADYNRLVTPLEQAIPALERLGPTRTGPTSDEINTMKSLAITWGINPNKFNNTVKDYDEAKKYLIDNARQLGNTSTNDQLAASFSANPNVEHMSQAASVDVSKTLLALRRKKYMQLQAFYDSGKPDEELPRFVTKWNAAHDSRAFAWDQYTVEQRKKILKTVKDVEQFKQDVSDSKAAGILTRPQDKNRNPSLE